MSIPIWSLITLFTEILVTASVYFIIWNAYQTGRFLRTFAFAVLGYELLFNISYMLSRQLGESGTAVYNPYETALAIFHGTFSIIMFVALITFFLRAASVYKHGENYFFLHKKQTIAFVTAWGVSILSGLVFFVSLYLF